MTTQSGLLLGERYRLGEPVPGTGEHTIHLAVDEWSGHRVLLTLVPVPADMPADRAAALRRRVGHRVEQATGVRHPRVGRVLGVVTDPARGLWVASETRADFRTLRAVREDEGGVAPGRVARWGGDIADGLAALHGAGLVHGNVSPELVSVSDDGSAALMAVAAVDTDGSSGEDPTADDGARRDVRTLASMLGSLLPSDADEPVDDLRRILRTGESDATVSAARLGSDLARSVNVQPTSAGVAPVRSPDVPTAPDESTTRLERGPSDPTADGPPAPAGVPIGSAPPGAMPPGATPPGAVPPGATPPGAMPPAAMPPGTAPPGSMPTGGLPYPTPPLPPPGGYATAGPAPLAPHHPPAGLGPHYPTVVTARPGIRSRIGRSRAWVVAAAVVAVGAVVATVAFATAGGAGDTPAQQPAAAQPVTPPSAPTGALGDPATADPCSLLTTASFRKFGSAQMFDDFGPYYTCTVDIDRSGSSVLATVYLYAPGEVAVGGGTERVGELVVNRRPAAGDSCSRQIALPDGSAVQVRASASGPPPADLCAVADAGTATAVSALNGRSVARRAPDPADPLVGLDMCALADPATGGRIAGVNTARITPGFGGFSCSMGYDPAFRNAAYAVYTVNRRPPLDGARTTVGRHSGVVTSYPASDGYSPSCSIALVQRSYVGSSGVARVGLVEVKLYGSAGATSQQICDGARTLAVAAESRLPAPQ